MTNLYDANYVAWYFDELGEREWTRLVNSPADEIKLYIHSHYLEKHIEPGSLVLDVGAGPGRFTQLLVSLGATVVVADISAQQIELNKRFAAELNFAHGVKEWRQLDICDMSTFADELFDAVVCYGNPLGYVFESLWGSLHELLPAVLTIDPAKNAEIIRVGGYRKKTVMYFRIEKPPCLCVSVVVFMEIS